MYFGMKAHIGADAESGLVHTVECAHKPGKSPAGAENPPNRCKKRCRVERLRVKSRHLKATDSLRHLAAGYSEHS